MSTKRKAERTKRIQESLLEANVGCLLMLIVLMGVPFVALGGFLIYIGHKELQEQARLNDKTIEVQAKIVSSEVRRGTTRTGPGTGSTTSEYWPEIAFRYEYDGICRTSKMVWPVGEGGREVEAKAVQRRYPQGAAVCAFVDPVDPEMAFLEKRWSQAPYLSVIIGVFPVAFVMGVGILLTGWKRPQIALAIATCTASLVLALAALAGDHYLRFMPEKEQHWGTFMAFALSAVLALIPLAAVLKARQLHRLYLEAMNEDAVKL